MEKPEYAPNYIPEDKEAFERLSKALGCAETPEELRTVTVMFILDLSYSRQDIYVAVRKVERNKGWD